jgi:hypothetical protein
VAPGAKKPQVDKSGTRPALRGLATGGSVRLRVSDGGKACVVFGDKLSLWLPVLKEMGLSAAMVLLRSDEMLVAVEALVLDDACVVVWGKDWSVFGSQVPHFGSREVIRLMDGRVSQEILLVAAGMNLVPMASTTAARRAVKGRSCQGRGCNLCKAQDLSIHFRSDRKRRVALGPRSRS